MDSETIPPSATSTDAHHRFAAVYRVLEEAIAAHAFPGCAFGVLADGETMLHDALGHFTYEESAPAVTPETV